MRYNVSYIIMENKSIVQCKCRTMTITMGHSEKSNIRQ